MVIPRLADVCAIDLADEGGYRRIVSAHVDPQLEQRATSIRERWPSFAESELVRESLLNGQPAIFHEVTDELLAKITANDEIWRPFGRLHCSR